MSKIAAAIATVKDQIAKLQEKLAELVKQEAAEALVAVLGAGYVVSFKVGRAETRREVTGVVLGRGLVKDVDSVRVSVGEGLEAELYTVPVTQLLSIEAPDTAKVSGEDALASGVDAVGGTSEAEDLLAGIHG